MKTRKWIRAAGIAGLMCFPLLSYGALITQNLAHSSSLSIDGVYGENIGWTQQTLQFEAFNPAFGKLNQVSLRLTVSQDLQAEIGHWEGEGGVLLEGDFGCGININNGSGLSLAATFFDGDFRDFSETPVNLSFGPYDHTETSVLLGDDTASFIGINPIEFDAYLSTYLFYLVAVPDTAFTVANHEGPDFFKGQSDAQLSLVVEYDYTPAQSVPEPLTLVLLSSGLVLTRAFRRKAAV